MNDRDCTPEEVSIINQRLAGGHLEPTTKKPDESRAFICCARTETAKSFGVFGCGKQFIPDVGQMIFHDLCNECFVEMDKKKMAWRLEQMEK